MKFSRRNFIKLTGISATIKGLSVFTPRKASGQTLEAKLKNTRVINTVCCYCAVHCGLNIYVKNNEVTHIEGDSSHPISLGQTCPKGGSALQLIKSPNRLKKPLYRSRGATEWQEVEWDWVLQNIAKRIKDTRDKTFKIKNDKGRTVNRTEGMAFYGGCSLDNEETFLLQKWLRSLGLIYIECQSRP
jgi:formate dehydrogenase major subunit